MTEFHEAQERFRPIPQRRVIEKLDGYMRRRDYAAAERHLRYWLEEARLGGDLRGELVLRNELAGLYRKAGERDRALENAGAALALLERLDMGDTVTAGTTCVNAATVMCAFGEQAQALGLFERARALYERGGVEPKLMGGLYNNMALCCASLGRCDEALSLYDRAEAQMAKVGHGALEIAITCLNRANLIEQRDGMEAGEKQIYALADRAVELLDGPDLPRDGYYAFVCEKCAPTLEYYGYFEDAARLKGEAERIYAGA